MNQHLKHFFYRRDFRAYLSDLWNIADMVTFGLFVVWYALQNILQWNFSQLTFPDPKMSTFYVEAYIADLASFSEKV
jgi:hypothetical protein